MILNLSIYMGNSNLYLYTVLNLSMCTVYGILNFWPTVQSVEPLVHCVVCLSSVCLSSVTFCIVAKRYVLAKNCLKERIENQGQKVDFWVAAIFLLPVSPLRPPRQPFLSVTFCIVAKRYVLAKNCLKK